MHKFYAWQIYTQLAGIPFPCRGNPEIMDLVIMSRIVAGIKCAILDSINKSIISKLVQGFRLPD
jgi:hypothetical protein